MAEDPEDLKKLADEVFAAKPKAGVRVGPAPIERWVHVQQDTAQNIFSELAISDRLTDC